MAPSMIAALPAISTVEQAADYASVVAPHLPQLETFYENFFNAIGNTEQLQLFYASTNPLITGFVFSLALAPIFLIASEINKNYSQVDRFWSILPTVYAVHYAVWAHVAGAPHEKVDIVAALGLIWSTRLTFNYWRRGGYNIGSEDYRWNIIQAQIHPAIFFLFNVTFISTIQSVSPAPGLFDCLAYSLRCCCSPSICPHICSSTQRASLVKASNPPITLLLAQFLRPSLRLLSLTSSSGVCLRSLISKPYPQH